MKQIDFIEEMNAVMYQIEIMILDNDPSYLTWLESQYDTECEFDR